MSVGTLSGQDFEVRIYNFECFSLYFEMADGDRLKMGPKPGVNYPIHVIYCGNCTMPIEVSEITTPSY